MILYLISTAVSGITFSSTLLNSFNETLITHNIKRFTYKRVLRRRKAVPFRIKMTTFYTTWTKGP